MPDNALLDDIVFGLGAEQVAYDLVYKQEALSTLKKGEALSKLQQAQQRLLYRLRKIGAEGKIETILLPDATSQPVTENANSLDRN